MKYIVVISIFISVYLVFLFSTAYDLKKEAPKKNYWEGVIFTIKRKEFNICTLIIAWCCSMVYILITKGM